MKLLQLRNYMGWILLAPVLFGCANTPTGPTYLEPLESKGKTARVRVVFLSAGTFNARIFPNANSLDCADEKDAVVLPVHQVSSGWEGDSKKLLGMPYSSPTEKKWGVEYYVDASKPFVLSVAYASSGSSVNLSCKRSLGFQPTADSDYRVSFNYGKNDKGQITCSGDVHQLTMVPNTGGQLIEVPVLSKRVKMYTAKDLPDQCSSQGGK